MCRCGFIQSRTGERYATRHGNTRNSGRNRLARIANLIALYGPTDYTRTRPLAKSSHILYSRNECLAALYNFGPSEIELAKRYPDYYLSMSSITVDDVIKKIEEIM